MQLVGGPMLRRGDARRANDSKLGTEHIPEIRRLLRTEMSTAKIAAKFGVSDLTFWSFVKRRGICDLKARREFISLQKSSAGEEL